MSFEDVWFMVPMYHQGNAAPVSVENSGLELKIERSELEIQTQMSSDYADTRVDGIIQGKDSNIK